MGLGATLYHAIAKRTPYTRGRHDATGAEPVPQLVEEPAPLDSMRHSPGLTALVIRTLARDPATRPTMAELFDRFDELGVAAGVEKVRFR